MPLLTEPSFTRQMSPEPEQVGLVIPPGAELSPSLRGFTRELAGTHGPPTTYPNHFSFHYVQWPPDSSLLVDGATVDTGIYRFAVRDAVVDVFELARWGHDEFCWSFSSNSQRVVLAAIRVGLTFDVLFDVPLGKAFAVLNYTFPAPGIPDTGYGNYAFHLSVDPPRPDGFRVVSAFEPESARTRSRLPFLFGFRVFGDAATASQPPVWRQLLSTAVQEAAHQRWAHCLLYTAFSVESFIDSHLADRLRTTQLGDEYIDHVLRVGERGPELAALSHALDVAMTRSSLEALKKRLNRNIFTPRNQVAHGRLSPDGITADQGVAALKTAVGFIWDWDATARALLLTPMRGVNFESLMDEDFLRACTEEAD